MDFFKVRKFRKARKPNSQEDLEEKPIPHPGEPNNENDKPNGKSVAMDAPVDVDEDDDDDFITNEVKRRLKELRRNSFMVLIPEEEGAEEEDEEEGETSSSEGRDMGTQVEHLYCDFESIYEKYCERMLFFDRMSSQQLNVAGPRSPSTQSPRAASRKLVSSFRCLSLKKMEEPDSDTEQLQQPDDSPSQDLETAYVAHICLTWEALHSQYTQLRQKISCQPDNPTCYNHCAQLYQQFEVLLQRFIENEPFEQGSRVEKYARSRNSLSKLLQVPKVQGTSQNVVEDEESEYRILAPDLLKLIQTSILTFYTFLRMDKKKAGGVRNLFGNQNQMTTPLQQVQSVADKKGLKLKELRKKKSFKKKAWPSMQEEVFLLLSLIDAKVVSRVLRMARITKDQLLWCEDKMRKLDLTDGKLHRDPSPILFPC
ncbi:hypothetical protein SOVF_112040 [Spinacia oleracea]|uniref:Uncharacterized protein LOC110785587 isoform X2 n=1 Tax=Spinacia oleracea TaxID=3562 RepID=A0A9R0JT99_SPIOL|nr:uncharacterized protein LOC110785587 isoform X2 [Spinacia oleracea]XP_056685379.1 uncharacterized protein LOC110785587 isoform X2 [Spinacia oleracea]XP_056685383.1 uncharacterized protein LOC110785587 isoform X2 [Spinacia oleracea]XP_056685387.1 uncharacterized protein LOC110785587 isoform X2 [Spinacia oleracea]KNA13931.1 hypothetical protein SOVF_112040 [Spinacia oleracea]